MAKPDFNIYRLLSLKTLMIPLGKHNESDISSGISTAIRWDERGSIY